MDMLQKNELTIHTMSAILGVLLNQEYWFTNPKSQIQLTEKREEERKEETEHRQMQSFMRFSQMQ